MRNKISITFLLHVMLDASRTVNDVVLIWPLVRPLRTSIYHSGMRRSLIRAITMEMLKVRGWPLYTVEDKEKSQHLQKEGLWT